GGRHRFVNTINFLTRLNCTGRAKYLEVAREFASRYEQPGLLIAISDFFDEGDCLRPLQFLSDFGHELLLIHVYADEDRTPPWDGQLDITDAETGAHIELTLDRRAREEYEAAFDVHAR